MVDQPSSPANNDLDPDPGSPPSTPRWVYAFGIIAIILVLLIVIRHVIGGGFQSHMGP